MSPLRSLAVLAALALCGPAPRAATPEDALARPEPHPLTLAARVWGLAKYHDPAVTACALDWDRVLLDAVPALESAGTEPAAFEAALVAMLDRAGDAGRRTPDATTPAWIAQAPISDSLRERLAFLAAQRPATQCYVSAAPSTRQALFVRDSGRVFEPLDRPLRALAAFRWWNAIEYFFPYKDVIGRPWSDVLDAELEAVLDAESQAEYQRAIRRLTAAIEDSHAFLQQPPLPGQIGLSPGPLVVQRLEGRDLVALVHPGGRPVAPGDELLAVDGQQMALRVAQWLERGHGSNPSWRHAQALFNSVAGSTALGSYRLARADGSTYTLHLPRGFNNGTNPPHPEAWRTRTLAGGCRFGIVDLAELEQAQVDAMFADLAATQAIVFDVRNYPNGTLWPIVDRLYPEPRAPARFTSPDFTRPGHFVGVDARIGGGRPNGYAGRILVLHDARSISQSEYTVMGLQATQRAITFGSQTAGADGNVTTIDLPGGIGATFTGLGVFYPDGRDTQRIGMVPDVHVVPTRAGLAAGRDEVLEAALDCRWATETPRPRLPRSGLYFSPARAGEGLDIHRDAARAAVLSYGFDDAGEPEWLLSGGALAEGAYGRAFRRYRDDGARSVGVDGHAVDFHRGPYAPACAIADQSALHPRAQWRWRAGNVEYDNCQLPLVESSGSNATGLWAGTGEELGWGLSVHHAAGVATIVVYAYDAAGAPRWVYAQGAWSGSGELTLPLQRARGFCRGCVATPLAWAPAGTITLTLDPERAGDPVADRVTIDAALGAASRWQRHAMPLVRLTGTPARD